MKQTTLREVVSYLAVSGATGLKKGPVRFLQYLLGKGDERRQLFIYLVHARNSRAWIDGMIDVFDPQGKRLMRRTLDECIAGIVAWVYSTLVNASDLMSGPEEVS